MFWGVIITWKEICQHKSPQTLVSKNSFGLLFTLHWENPLAPPIVSWSLSDSHVFFLVPFSLPLVLFSLLHDLPWCEELVLHIPVPQEASRPGCHTPPHHGGLCPLTPGAKNKPLSFKLSLSAHSAQKKWLMQKLMPRSGVLGMKTPSIWLMSFQNWTVEEYGGVSNFRLKKPWCIVSGM